MVGGGARFHGAVFRAFSTRVGCAGNGDLAEVGVSFRRVRIGGRRGRWVGGRWSHWIGSRCGRWVGDRRGHGAEGCEAFNHHEVGWVEE